MTWPETVTICLLPPSEGGAPPVPVCLPPMVSPDLLSIPPWAQNKANGPIFLAHPAEGGDNATSEAREPRGSGIWVCFARYSVPRASNRTRQDVSTRQIFVDLREKTLPVPAWSLCARCRVKSLRSVLSLNPPRHSRRRVVTVEMV